MEFNFGRSKSQKVEYVHTYMCTIVQLCKIQNLKSQKNLTPKLQYDWTFILFNKIWAGYSTRYNRLICFYGKILLIFAKFIGAKGLHFYGKTFKNCIRINAENYTHFFNFCYGYAQKPWEFYSILGWYRNCYFMKFTTAIILELHLSTFNFH